MKLYKYRDMHNRPGRTGLTVGTFENMPVCIFSELNSNHGASVTNSSSQVINQVRRDLKLSDDTRYFEHYHWASEGASIDEVLPVISEDIVTMVEWQSMDEQFINRMTRYITFAGIDGEY